MPNILHERQVARRARGLPVRVRVPGDILPRFGYPWYTTGQGVVYAVSPWSNNQIHISKRRFQLQIMVSLPDLFGQLRLAQTKDRLVKYRQAIVFIDFRSIN